MAKSCVYIPSKGVTLFSKLKSEYGYNIAKEIFPRVITPKFIKTYKGTLSLDAEGIPTFETVINIPIVQEYVGETTILKSLNSKYKPVEHTLQNYKEELQRAKTFNDKSTYNKKYVAIVKQEEEGIRVNIVHRTEDTAQQFAEQYASLALAEKLEDIFKPLGVNVGLLTATEVKAGVLGSINFNKMQNIATDFSSIIRVANNNKGLKAISEEFSHLLVEIFKDNTLVQRALSYIKENEQVAKSILGDQYEKYQHRYAYNKDRIAEEALGQALHAELLAVQNNEKLPILTRIKNWILQQFKRFKASDVDIAISETFTSMNSLAKHILSENNSITQEDILKTQSEKELNALNDDIDKRQELLKKIIVIEEKRRLITNKDDSLDLDLIKASAGENGNNALGIFQYLYHALEKLRELNNSMMNIKINDHIELFKFLRAIRTYTSSYDSILKDLEDILIEEQEEEGIEKLSTMTFSVPGEKEPVMLTDLVSQVSRLSSRLEQRWIKVSHRYLSQFLSKYYDTNTIVNGQKIAIEDLLAKCVTDVSFTERWLDALSDSSDPLLQTLDAVVKDATDKVREQHIIESRKIISLRQDMEAAGITSTEWMYERDAKGNLTGYYISEIDYPAFYEARRKFIKQLDEKYGTATIGKKASERNAKMREWNSENMESIYGNIPNKNKYRSKAYSSLSSVQKSFLQKCMELKKEYDAMYPEDRTNTRKAIQIRRHSSQRTLDAITSPKKAMEAVKDYFQESFVRTASDETEFGTIGGLRDFNGAEFFALPILYTNNLQNMSDLSTDFFSTLMQYSYATLRYQELSKVVDPLEVARTWIKENRVTHKTRGGKALQEAIKIGGQVIKQDIIEDGSTNIAKMIDDYYESQLYGRYMKEGTEIAGMNSNKIVNRVMGLHAMASLSFNWLSQIANAFNGIAMQTVESAARQFFSAKDLLKADTQYAKHISAHVANIGARNAYDTLSLLGDFFNIKQDYNKQVSRIQNKNVMQRALGSHISFIGQEAGDHWLYFRTAIAMMHKQQVKVPGKGEMSLWEALQVRDSAEGHGMKEMYLPEGTTDLEGNLFSASEFGRKIAKVNHGLFGIYNTEDSNAAHRTALGRLALQFRKWMKPLINKRFQKRQYNRALGTEEEGYYRTLLKILGDVWNARFNLVAVKENLSEMEKQNFCRAFIDTALLVMVSMLCSLVDWPDDEDTPKIYQYAELVARRMKMELGALHPAGIVTEGKKTLQSPIPAMSTLASIYDIISLVNPFNSDWYEEIESGPYKGMTKAQKKLYKAPVWGLVHIRQISKMLGEQDQIINYYARPW